MSSFKILDGATGSELIKRGIILPKYIWSANANIYQKNSLYKIHVDYINAGANYITANTFRSTPRAYRKKRPYHSMQSIQNAKISMKEAIKIAKKASTKNTQIIGSIAPLEDCYKPKDFPGIDIAVSEFLKIGNWLVSYGVDILMLETMNSKIEISAAIKALKNFQIPIWVSFVLQDHKTLLSGDTINEVLNFLQPYNVEVVLINCSPMGRTMRAVDNIVNNWAGKWGVYPNLGIGAPSPTGNIKKHESIDKFISFSKYCINNGAAVIGACCGSSPNHIAELNKLKTNS